VKRATILLIAVLVLLAATAQARDPIVYISKAGHTYHKANCTYLGKGKTAIKLSVAKKRGYTRCPWCHHPKYVTDPRRHHGSTQVRHHTEPAPPNR
jgi:outer membrane biogenesis lipoprotein LolB